MRGDQASVRLVIQRGGTSRGLYLHAADLPPAGADRDQLLARLMGSPDVLQIDGLGGSRPITSKIAIISASGRSDADVDYTFAQVDIATGNIGYDGNCGNISAGVGPFAIDEGLMPATEGVTSVRIWNTNTAKLLIADVPVRGGAAAVEGDFVVPGVPGTGAEIVMNWAATVGAATGRLLPTGRPQDRLTLDDGSVVDVSIVDAGNPCVWIRGEAVGVAGNECIDAINGDTARLARCQEIRGRAAVLLGMAEDWRDVARHSPGLPMLGLVNEPIDYVTINGAAVSRSDMDLRVHLLFMGVLHESIAGTGSISLAAASRVPGTVVEAVTHDRAARRVRIGHPSGVTPARVTTRRIGEPPHVAFEDLGFSRTARRIMEGRAFYPRGASGAA